MSKYIIELDGNAKKVVAISLEDGIMWTDEMEVDDLEELNYDYINEHYGSLQDEAYQRGLEEGKKAFDLLDAERDSEYQRGLDDGWEAARKIFGSTTDGGYRMEQIRVILGKRGLFCAPDVIRQCTINEVVEKLKAYEEKQKTEDKIKRGDVVRNKGNGLTYIVTLASEYGYVLLGSDGNFTTSCITNSFEKTGKHVDIDKILEAMKE